MGDIRDVADPGDAKRRFGKVCSGAVRRSSGTERARREQEAVPGNRHIGRAVRREVAERDGIQCSWTDDTGRRCQSRAWLEYDHRRPFARGGASAPDNVRLLCRAHNHLAAEQAYGRAHMERVPPKPPQSLRNSRRAAHWSGVEQRSRRRCVASGSPLRVERRALADDGCQSISQRGREGPFQQATDPRSSASRIWFHATGSRCDVQGGRAEVRPNPAFNRSGACAGWQR